MKFVNAKPTEKEFLTCAKHGRYEVTYSPWIHSGQFMRHDHCVKCAGEEAQKARDQEAAENLQRKKQNAGLGKRHANCTFESFIADTAQKASALKQAKDYCKRVLDGDSSCLVMSGRVGTGKTHLAAAIVNELIAENKRVRLVRLSDILREVKSSWSKNAQQTESEALASFSKPDLLIIDEVGVQFGSDTEKMFIGEIVDNRYIEMLPTVLISNLEASKIKECVGERCYDRLRQDGGKLVAFDWDSQRGVA